MTAKNYNRLQRRIVKAEKDLKFHRERLEYNKEQRDAAQDHKKRLRFARVVLNCQVLIDGLEKRLVQLHEQTKVKPATETPEGLESYTPMPYRKSGVKYCGSVLGQMA